MAKGYTKMMVVSKDMLCLLVAFKTVLLLMAFPKARTLEECWTQYSSPKGYPLHPVNTKLRMIFCQTDKIFTDLEINPPEEQYLGRLNTKPSCIKHQEWVLIN